MTQPTYYTPDGLPVFVDPPQHSGQTMPDRRIEVYTSNQDRLLKRLKIMCREWREAFGGPDENRTPGDVLENSEALIAEVEAHPGGPTDFARSFTGKGSVPCAVPERETDREWLSRKSAQEDGCIVSVGGLVTDLESVPEPGGMER
jgi:hypothetical protein